ncbi:MAG: hypothetical protein IPJ19_11035 [Planctomycetes bacterium]|nr:hypothetical protein [Planctomycetota bacterium]
MFGFGCLAFVFVCTVLAIACFLVFKSGSKGTTKLGAPAGCMVGCSLVLIALLAAFGVTLVLAFHAKQELVRNGPVKRFEFQLEPRTPGASTSDTQHARLVLEMRPGEAWTDLAEEVSGWLRERVHGEISVRMEPAHDEHGSGARLIFETEVPERDLERLRHDLRDVLPTLRLPAHVEVELKDD